jgi:hypothetical protein
MHRIRVVPCLALTQTGPRPPCAKFLAHEVRHSGFLEAVTPLVRFGLVASTLLVLAGACQRVRLLSVDAGAGAAGVGGEGAGGFAGTSVTGGGGSVAGASGAANAGGGGDTSGAAAAVGSADGGGGTSGAAAAVGSAGVSGAAGAGGDGGGAAGTTGAAGTGDAGLAPSDGGADADELACMPPASSEETWLACAGGCTACPDILQRFDLYFDHNPGCRPGAACGIVGSICGGACPMPTRADSSCSSQPGNWMGCRGSGCNVDPAVLGQNRDPYIKNHPFCTSTASSGPAVPCAAMCPPVTVGDTFSCDVSANGWPGCRGYGCWVCAELVRDYPRYFQNHPACTPNTTCHSVYYGCNSACPMPGPADK